jgi:predicted nuclease of predicted toxin-antitoxin system
LPRKPHERVVFFVDRSLGGKLVVQALQAAGVEVVVHDNVFGQNTPDQDWLAVAGKRGWVVLTKDSAIRRNPLERETYRAANARVFALTRKDLLGTEMAEIFVRALPGVLRRIETTPPPFVFSISRKGEFVRLD